MEKWERVGERDRERWKYRQCVVAIERERERGCPSKYTARETISIHFNKAL